MKKYAVYYTIRTGINRQIVVEDCVNAARPAAQMPGRS